MTEATDPVEDEEERTHTFEELSASAKKHAIEKYADPDHNWWDSEFEFRKEEGTERGYRIDDIYFRVFWSQGDGASWEGAVDMLMFFERKRDASQGQQYVTYDVLATLVETNWLPRFARVARSGRGEHEMTMFIAELEASWLVGDEVVDGESVYAGANVGDLLKQYFYDAEIEDVLLEEVRDYAREIYRSLKAEYESYFEEENFAELAEANSWRFYEDGDLL
jgi:hypothetical protein